MLQHKLAILDGSAPTACTNVAVDGALVVAMVRALMVFVREDGSAQNVNMWIYSTTIIHRSKYNICTTAMLLPACRIRD
jgi:hypothetical protein